MEKDLIISLLYILQIIGLGIILLTDFPTQFKKQLIRTTLLLLSGISAILICFFVPMTITTFIVACLGLGTIVMTVRSAIMA